MCADEQSKVFHDVSLISRHESRGAWACSLRGARGVSFLECRFGPPFLYISDLEAFLGGVEMSLCEMVEALWGFVTGDELKVKFGVSARELKFGSPTRSSSI